MALALGDESVWVLEDPRGEAGAQAVGIAERLAVPFRRLPMSWNWLAPLATLSGTALARRGSLLGVAGPLALSIRPGPRIGRPEIVISADSRSAVVALWLRAHTGARIVHCLWPHLPFRPLGLAAQSDLLVLPRHEGNAAENQIQVLAPPNRVSPMALAEARAAWSERLSHLPQPRIILLAGGSRQQLLGGEMRPAAAHSLGLRLAHLAQESGGSVLAATGRHTGAEATEALAAGLARVMHLLYRWGDPGPDPVPGYLALADAIVVAAGSASMVSEACATAAPVYVASPELAPPLLRRLHAGLFEAGQARPLGDALTSWPRVPLDEAGRVAGEILRRFGPLERIADTGSATGPE